MTCPAKISIKAQPNDSQSYMALLKQEKIQKPLFSVFGFLDGLWLITHLGLLEMPNVSQLLAKETLI